MKSNSKIIGAFLVIFTLIASGCNKTTPAEQIEGTYAGTYSDGEKTGIFEATVNITITGNNQVTITLSALSTVIFKIENVNITVQDDGTILLNIDGPLQIVTGMYKDGQLELNVKLGNIEVYLFVGVQQ